MSDSEQVIELVQLPNGDIVLRDSENPEHSLVTIKFSDAVEDLFPADKLNIGKAMIEAGIERFGEIQYQRIEDAQEASEAGLLH